MKKRNGRSSGSIVILSATCAMVALTSTRGNAAGLEKSVFWSGKYTGIVGAAQSSAAGAESLYWNPAGLGGSTGFQLNGNFSPTISKFSGPFGANPAVQDSSTGFSPLASGFLSYAVTPELGVGIGAYISAANKSEYDAVNLGLQGVLGTTYNPPFRGNIALIETSLGAGYEVMPGLKIGAGWRVTFASAELSLARVSGANLVGIQAQNLTQTVWDGIRVGAEWNPKDSPFGIGVTWRNRTDFTLGGNANVTVANGASPAGTQVVNAQPVTASANLPMRFDIATHYKFNPAWTGFLGYTFTNYSDEESINIAGFPTAVIPGGQVIVPLGWSNMQNARIAGEYRPSEMLALRAGYVFTSQVTPKGYASPILPSPGTGHTIVAGAGTQLMEGLGLDGAFEYIWDSGTVAASDIPTGSNTAAGDYTARAFALHIGATYSF